MGKYGKILYNIYIYGWWFQPTPLKNMISSVGMMTFPTEWKVIKIILQTTNQNCIYISLITNITPINPNSELSRSVMGSPLFSGIKRRGTSPQQGPHFKMGTHDPPGEAI
jgi:hypothetical protein